MKEPILITGCARSGTSMVAGIINMSGAFGGTMSGPTKNNARGMFENAAIRDSVVKPYLISINADKMGQFPLPDIDEIMIPNNWEKKVVNIFKEQGYENGPWMYKGAKMCLHWPVWNHAFPNAKWVIVRRRTGDIVSSCLKTSFMRAFQNPKYRDIIGVDTEQEGWVWWVRQHEARFVEMIQAGLNCKIVWPERMVNGDYSQMKEMLEWVGLEWNSDIPSFIEPKLWKARKNK